MNDLFERVQVINLARSKERLRSFYSDLPDPWPFARPVRFAAIDGQKVRPPESYEAKPAIGSWGCFRSHYRVLEDALNDDVKSLLVFEDDAVFVPNFHARAQQFFEALPDDWDYVYLGGKHIEREKGLPVRINRQVFRPYNVHSCLAYGLRGEAIERLYKHINSPAEWGPGHCIDHRFGETHKNYPGGIYTPAEWLVGHRGGHSDIRPGISPRAFFLSASQLTEARLDKPMLAVVGENLAATNKLAMMLHLLGVPMGENLVNADMALEYIDPTCLAPGLIRLLHGLFDIHSWTPKTSATHRIQLLRFWAHTRASLPHNASLGYLGAVHPLLSILGAELMEAWNSPLIVRAMDEPDAQGATSTDGQLEQRAKAAEGLENIDRLAPRQLRLHTAKQSPVEIVNLLCSELCLTPSEERRQAAIALACQSPSQQSR